MSLTAGNGPFGPRPGIFVGFEPPGHVMYWEDWPRRMRAVVDGETILDTRSGKLLHETGAFSTIYFPREAIAPAYLEVSETTSDDKRRGGARYWHLVVRDRTVRDAVVEYVAPPPTAAPLAGWITVSPDAVDHWMEEDELVYAHLRDPYHRVDVLLSSRHVVVRHAGHVIAETDRPKILFETGLPPRYYLPFADVRSELLERSDTVSQCPYKGEGQHWHLRVGSGTLEDACWSLPHPLPEGLTAARHLCFYPGKVEVVVDGNTLDEPPVF